MTHKFLKRDNVYTVSGIYITNDTISKLNELDKEYYDSEYIWTVQNMRELYKSEKNSYILVKDGSKIIGYVNFLNLKKDIYDNMMESDKIYDTFIPQDIIPYNKNQYNYVSINSIVLKNEYQNKDSINKMVNAINKYLKAKESKGYKIAELNSFAVNSFETIILEKLEFKKAKKINNECYLYALKFHNDV